MAKNTKLVNFMATKREQAIIEEVRKNNYLLNQSEVIRWLLNEGAKHVLEKRTIDEIDRKYV